MLILIFGRVKEAKLVTLGKGQTQLAQNTKIVTFGRRENEISLHYLQYHCMASIVEENKAA